MNFLSLTLNHVWAGTTPLSTTVDYCFPRMVKKLVEAGADLSLKYDGLDILAYAKKRLQEWDYFMSDEGQAIVEYLRQDDGLRASEASTMKNEPKSSKQEVPQRDTGLLHFPSEDVILSCLKHHPMLGRISGYLYEKGIIPSVAHFFADQEKVPLGVDVGVSLTLADLQEKLNIPEPAILSIQMNLVEALKECAAGKH